MEYCSLQDAFPENTDWSAVTQRKEEKKKAKRCRGPPLKFLEPEEHAESVVDPDRPALRPKPEVPPLNSRTGLRQHAPVDAPPLEPFQDLPPVYGESGNPSLMATLRSEQPPAQMVKVQSTLPRVAGPTRQQPTGNVPAFFGANLDEDVGADSKLSEGFASFTDVIGDDPSYRLEPDFAKSFEGHGLEKAAGSSILPVPSVNNFWKPLTPAGSRTAFFEKLPAPGGTYPPSVTTAEMPKDELFAKLDKIYARLDDLEIRRNENSQSEIIMFTLTGLFVLFSMDLLVRKTGNVRVATRR
jgi:hypothetical protein